MKDLKSAIAHYFNKQQLSRRQLKLLFDLQDKHQGPKIKIRHIKWGLIITSISFLLLLLIQFINKDQGHLPTNDKTYFLVKNISLLYNSNLEPTNTIHSFQEIPKIFDKLKFTPVDNSNISLLKDSKLIGASYVPLIDSLGLYLLYEDMNNKKQYAILQKKLMPQDKKIQSTQSIEYKGLNINIWVINGIINTIVWR